MSKSSLPTDDQRCPCTSGNLFGACCGPVLKSGEAPGALRLMRSRFTAFAVGDAGHLLRTWHASTRPDDLELDDDVRWYRLDILDQQRGGPFDVEGVVEFEAFYRQGAERGSMRERSRFVREDGSWFYVDGIVASR
ncbi:hypothetical protein JF531_01735 [Microbacterium esteraromaticum]|uniref:YchJ family protein n=1 Tax=Microbacterium esteraromaticum TaxID=57043 RepID=UPI001A902A3C|nr:YchJ family metal-binding protein [Microbacterium esteraromaticum]MBN8423239.1 hypothetical protein [Microbacterium esteraromaticum]